MAPSLARTAGLPQARMDGGDELEPLGGQQQRQREAGGLVLELGAVAGLVADLGQRVFEAVVLGGLRELDVVVVVPVGALLDGAGHQTATDVGNPVGKFHLVGDAFGRHGLQCVVTAIARVTLLTRRECRCRHWDRTLLGGMQHVLIQRMDYGLVLFTSDRGIAPAAAAKLADDHGFTTFYVPEHTHIPVKREAAHPTTGDESLPDDRYMRTLDPWVSLGTACAVTSQGAAVHRGGAARRARPDHAGEIDCHP